MCASAEIFIKRNTICIYIYKASRDFIVNLAATAAGNDLCARGGERRGAQLNLV